MDTGLNYLTLHYQGHGEGDLSSSGSVEGVSSLQEWIDAVLAVVSAASRSPGSPGPLTHDASPLPLGKLILVGSSLGAWIALHVALLHPELVSGLVLVAPAVDASVRWAHCSSAPTHDEQFIRIQSAYVPSGSITLRKTLVEDANARFLLLDDRGRQRLATLHCPVRVLQGELDDVVPCGTASMLGEVLANAEVEILPGGDHRLSRPEDLAKLREAVATLAQLN